MPDVHRQAPTPDRLCDASDEKHCHDHASKSADHAFDEKPCDDHAFDKKPCDDHAFDKKPRAYKPDEPASDNDDHFDRDPRAEHHLDCDKPCNDRASDEKPCNDHASDGKPEKTANSGT